MYQYVLGANVNSSRLMITSPILTTMAQAVRGSEFTIRYLDGKNAILGDKSYYKVAQYNASSHLFGVDKRLRLYIGGMSVQLKEN
ncbi:hypothetical protein RJ640_008945, partial [Escallonia rubra]